jgi:hypothetical protein
MSRVGKKYEVQKGGGGIKIVFGQIYTPLALKERQVDISPRNLVPCKRNPRNPGLVSKKILNMLKNLLLKY